ncbi:MAG: hypothetical protein OHK0024_26750 [Thalassobaculales bacterium]
MSLDPWMLLTVAGALLAAGFVKGVVGLGLPAVTLALLTLTIGLKPAMAVLLAPSIVTNLQQAATGGQARAILRRFWPFLVPATLLVPAGTAVLAGSDGVALSGLLGLSLIAYAGFGLRRWRLTLSAGAERVVSPLVGVANGLLTGMTGSFAVPGVPYLQALGLQRDMLVQAMGILFSLSTVALALSLGGGGLLSAELGAVSAIAVLPAVAGMWLGRRCRARLSEEGFRRLLLGGLALIGLHLAIAAVLKLW